MSDIHWQKSSYSTNGGDNSCVELARQAGSVLVREGDEPGVIAVASPARAAALLGAVKRGAFDGLN